ncbi:MAG: putative endonuclease [Frankiales bacterium]|nr:putative endonuclease [Frankiales bacterium]
MITDWQARPVPEATTDERLAALVDREIAQHEAMLFTLTPREELDAIGRAQQLADQAWVQGVRAIVAAHSRSCVEDREFAADEIGLALGVGFKTAQAILAESLGVAGLPGMLEAVHAGMLSQRHALAVLRTLNEVPTLAGEHRRAISTIVIARVGSRTPRELQLLTRRLILTVDLAAAQARQDAATGKRKVLLWPVADGQGVLQSCGPLERLAAVRASLRQWLLDNPKAADDPRSESEREFDLFVALLTGGAEAGSWQAAIVVPFSTTVGGELELAEIPGLGPILPSTARDLLEDAEWTQVAVDQDGAVIAVSDPIPTPKAAAPKPQERARENWELSLAQLMSQPPKAKLMPEQLGIEGYVTSARLRRYLQARDRTCVFPGCHRRVTDVDHRIPWPLGPTAHHNLQLLCRHHHRGKQAVFTVELTDDGDYLWTTRGGWQFLRHRQGY